MQHLLSHQNPEQSQEILVSREAIRHVKQVLRSAMQAGVSPPVMGLIMEAFRSLDDATKD